MKPHTNQFKINIKELGRQLKGQITYGLNVLEDEIYSITPHYEANILKSVMKQLDLELSVDIPLETVINCKIGILVGNDYEMLDYGNYVVYNSEKQEDTGTYKITCYDKLLYSMKQNEDLGVAYPIKIKDYLNALANKIGLSVATTTFYNENREIQNELYLGLDYTYRDILDEIAQATGSIICLNENDEILVKYPTHTNDTIDESYLKDVNVDFGQQYGAINTIVLSRSGESDNIYYPEILPENPVEIKIVDNQIMNFNDRSDYLPGIYNALNGLYYYINDFNSTGILYYDVGDLYNVQIGENTYQCLMLNDEVNVTTGIEEIIHTDMPEQSQTDYTKADKTDRKINQTYLIVDKQNQQIESLITQIGDRSQKQTTITQDIDGIAAIVEDIEDITDRVENIKTISLENCVEGNLLELHIYGNNTVFDYLRISNNLIISDDLKIYGDSIIEVTNEAEETTIYDLGINEVLRQNGNIRDEYVLQNGEAKVIRRIASNGSILSNEIIEDLGEMYIHLSEGTNIITIKNYNATLNAKFVIKNDYTDIFATKVEMNSSITQTANEINLRVEEKLDEEDFTGANITLAINNDSSSATINADKININGTVSANGNFKVDTDGNMECNNAKISAFGGNDTGDSNGLNLKVLSDEEYKYSGLAPAFAVIRNSQNNYINMEASNVSGGRNICWIRNIC